MKKGDVIEGIVTCVDYPNKGYIEVEGQRILVKNAMPGQKVQIRINKKRKNHLEGRLLEVLEPSALETRSPLCGQFPSCGGCMYQTMGYDAQLAMKETQVRNLLDEALSRAGQVNGEGRPDYLFEGIQASPSELAYRNKMEYAFGDAEKDGPLTLGLHKKGSSYDILTAADCAIVHEDFNRILSCVLDYFRQCKVSYYHRNTHIGYLRHLLVRRAESTGELLIALVTSSQLNEFMPAAVDELSAAAEAFCGTDSCDGTASDIGQEAQADGASDELSALCRKLQRLELTGNIAGILHIINDSVADVVQSDETRILYGRDYFYEEILGLRFKITPFSFFQTNTAGAEVLYTKAREMIGDVTDATVFDLYSGTGTIAQVLSPAAGKVIGVEIVEEAVEAAKENAAANGLTNCSFLAGDVLKVLDEISEKPDFIVLDPPRDGIHPKALPKIIAYGVDRIVYISCKATSLARDLDLLLTSGYRLERACCVDMFPQTVHVETVCLLSKLSEAKHSIDVKLNMDELDVTTAETKATYEEIKAYVLEQTGLQISSLYIAQVKRECGIIERENYNKPKTEDTKQPPCPEDKRKAIEEALKHFGMI